MEKKAHKTYLKQFSREKNNSVRFTIQICMFFMIFLMSISFISALNFDNTESFDKDIGNYGKYKIRDWWGLLKLQDVELKTNTEKCSANNCEAVKEIIMYQDEVLIDDVRYFDLKTGELTEIVYSRFYILQGNKKIPYELGTKIKKGTYQVVHEGVLFNFQSVDWQVLIGGSTWTNEWATWTSELNAGLSDYFKFDESGSVNGSVNSVRPANNMNSTNNTDNKWITGIINNAFNMTKDRTDRVQNMTNISNMYLNLTGETNWTIGMWIKPSVINTGLFQTTDSADINLARTRAGFTGTVMEIIMYNESNSNVQTASTDSILLNDWGYFTFVWNGSGTGGDRNNMMIYINGTKQTVTHGGAVTHLANYTTPAKNFLIGRYDNSEWEGGIDEVGIWNRSLTASEITDLYNSGAGISYTPSSEITSAINLSSPHNNSILSASSENFTVHYNLTGTNANIWNWTNTTYYIWYDNGTIFNQTTKVLTGNNTYNITLIPNFTIGDYKWNALGYYGNATYTNFTWADSNSTFEWRPFEIDSQTYTDYVYETDNKRFILNITTIEDILSVTSKLNYNGTLYSASTTDIGGGKYNVQSDIDIPLVGAESENKSFYWNVTLYDGTSTYSFNTVESTKQQNVSRVYIKECNETYPTYSVNFTAYIEGNLTRLNPFKIDGTFNTWLGAGTVNRNNSFSWAETSNLSICISPNNTFYTDATIDYSFGNENITYVPRNYYFDNASLTNVTQHILLYLLESTDSTTFIIKVQDQKLSAVEGALVYIQRYYPSDGTYRTVQVAKTDSNGETIGFYETETVDYKHIITKDGIVLLETTPQKVVGKSVPYTLTFTTGTGTTYPWSPFEKDSNIQSSLTYNKTTFITTFTYIDSTGTTNNGRLLVIEPSRSNSTYTVICNTTSTQASATLTCNMTDYTGTFVAYGYIQNEVVDLLEFVITSARDIFGREGLLIGMFIIMVSGFAFIWNPSAGIIAINAAIIFTNIIGFISVSPVFIFGTIAISIIAIILLKT